MKYFDRTRSDFSPYGFTCEQWQPARMPRPDRHNEIEINLLQSGSLSYLLGGHRIDIGAERLSVFWAAIPHQIVAFEDTTPYYVVTLPLSDFLLAGLDTDFVSRVLHGELIIDPAKDKTDAFRLQQWEQDLRNDDAVGEQAARLEVRARLLRVARKTLGRSRLASPSPLLSRADQLACYIARNYQQPLTSSSIASANGLHPNYAMNLFRRTFGTTILQFVTEHRISHAQRLLATADDAVLTIAMDAGFQSLSRFNEAFKAACGCSPREYRKAHRAAMTKDP
ncbi:Melibiose operon regulatory protein [Posidoniimonas corsicana]|uniref:Melibiose operon regulatory protein n=1 Tax=Posidoniimonas corsicana TaxID=1938618 RepID=A0A5C5VDH5_9BACT|nr:helix-turn-helix domain-containing protein [Posidoniimonas corsicana]TWT36648.1 Melibiose operon regulatory protein [Posidoniimonas corsicana]